MRRGVTLLELLLALALVIALSAIALPAMLATSEHKKLDNAAEALEEQLLQARAHAMVSGMPLEVRYDRERRRMIVCEIVSSDDAREERRFEQPEDEQEQRDALPIVKRSWADIAVDDAITISNEPPAFVESEDEVERVPDAFAMTSFGMSGAAMDDQAERDQQALITFVLFLPDGSAPIVEPIWLATEDERAMRIDVGRWTGLPRIDREPAIETEQPEEPDDEPDDETRDDELAADESGADEKSAEPDPGAREDAPEGDKGDADSDEDEERERGSP